MACRALRLGFALCDAELAGRLRAALGPWSVCGPALAIGAAALADAAWLAARAAQLAEDAARLDALLREADLDIVGGTCAVSPRALRGRRIDGLRILADAAY